MADGGEGTTDAVLHARRGEKAYVNVHGPLMEPVRAYYGRLSETEAILEMARASGLPLVPESDRNPLYTTTCGTGELVKAALERADLVVTCKGRIDWQSCFGKVMQGVGDRAKRHGVPVVALCGGLGPGYEEIYRPWHRVHPHHGGRADALAAGPGGSGRPLLQGRCPPVSDASGRYADGAA